MPPSATYPCVHFIGSEVKASGPCSQLSHNLVPLGVMGKIRTPDRRSGLKYLGPMEIISVIFISLIVGAIAKF